MKIILLLLGLSIFLFSVAFCVIVVIVGKSIYYKEYPEERRKEDEEQLVYILRKHQEKTKGIK